MSYQGPSSLFVAAALLNILIEQARASLAQMEFNTSQTAFIKWCDANMGAHVQREGHIMPHVDHVPALRALDQMVVKRHSRALMAQVWSQSTVRAGLGSTSSQSLKLHRGHHKGPRKSPVLVAMILECVVRRCEERWARFGCGFWTGGKRWVSSSYADDIFIISAARLPRHDRRRGRIKSKRWSGSWSTDNTSAKVLQPALQEHIRQRIEKQFGDLIILQMNPEILNVLQSLLGRACKKRVAKQMGALFAPSTKDRFLKKNCKMFERLAFSVSHPLTSIPP